MALDVSSSARRPAVGCTHSSADAGWFFTHSKENTIFFMSVFNQRSVINVWLLAPLPAVAVSVVSFFYALCVPDFGSPLPGLFMWRSDVCRVGGDIPRPFWEALTLNTKGWDRLSSAAPTSHSGCIDIDPETHSLRPFFVPLFYVCVCERACKSEKKKKECVTRSDFSLEGHDNFPSLQVCSDGQKTDRTQNLC